VVGIIPWSKTENCLLDSEKASARGFSRLAIWLGNVEQLWNTYGKKKSTFQQKIDFRRLLSIQFPIRKLRVVYCKSGTNPTAAIVRDEHTILDHKLYWLAVNDEDEAAYLVAILNSETTRERASKWQSEGQFGKRDFDKAAFHLPIPQFNPKNPLHQQIAQAGREAELLAQKVNQPDATNYMRFRKSVRQALTKAGVSNKIDALVKDLLDIP
jgi:hypothetical protein